MSTAKIERAAAARLPADDLVGILLQQHARIRELFAEVGEHRGAERQQRFDELRALLAVHETAEEMILRPVAKRTAGAEEAAARDHEEEEANAVLAELESMDVDDEAFDAKLAEFRRAVVRHAESEENEEFPAIRKGCGDEELQAMGRVLVRAEKAAPTHPHPGAAGSTAAQWITGPFASLLDRARDAIGSARKG